MQDMLLVSMVAKPPVCVPVSKVRGLMKKGREAQWLARGSGVPSITSTRADTVDARMSSRA